MKEQYVSQEVIAYFCARIHAGYENQVEKRAGGHKHQAE